MKTLISILVAVLVFGLIIGLHELGHFLIAKANGIRVNKFAMGMGPKLLAVTKGETEYSLRLFPVGGFVAMEGEDTPPEEDHDPRAYSNKSVWRRLTVILAGPLMNLFLGFVLIVVLGCTMERIPTTTIARFAQDDSGISMAQSEADGLQVGDRIVALNGVPIFTTTDLLYKMQTSSENTYDVTVRRGSERVTLSGVTFHNKKTDGMLDFGVEGAEKNPWTLVRYGALDTVATSKLIWISLGELISGKYGVQDLSGPIGTVQVIGEAAQAGENFFEHFQSVVNLSIFLTINIGIFNLLPIPGLDGSKIVLLVIEGIRRKPLPREKEAMINLIGFAAIFILMIFVTIQDVGRLFR